MRVSTLKSRWTFLLSAALAAGLPSPVPAQQGTGASAGEDRKLTITAKDLPLRQAIDQIFSGSGLQYAIDANVPDVPITLSLRDVGLQTALRVVVRQASSQVPGLTTSRDGDVYVVRIRQKVVEPVAVEETPPEMTAAAQQTVWEKIPIQFNSVIAILYGLMSGSVGVVPTEAQILMSSMGGQGGGGFGSSGSGGGFGGNGFGSSGFGSSGIGAGAAGSGSFGSGSFGGLGGSTSLGGSTGSSGFGGVRF